MYKAHPADQPIDAAKLQLGYAETDPSGRYGRFRDILGKGAMKTVYRAFDEFLGMEVAWNQVKLNHVFKTPDEMQRLYSEVHLLKNLDHDSIMQFYTSWVDIDRRTFNFITEMFTSGTLREYRHKYKRVNIRAVKNWARQILEGLVYLHGHDPPVIHRDLKCDNIFVNGHLGQVKIGDLGLAAILRGSHHAHSVIGTPEFMAPELYEEEYDELVDIYSFGMCVLEMLTSEYPYCECSNPAQIYKKVTSGKLPEAFYRIQDVEAQKFIGKCLEPASKRPSARELLMDPFLALDEEDKQLTISTRVPCDDERLRQMRVHPSSDPLIRTTDMTITGTMKPEDDTIFLKVQISSKDGQARNIYFPFDISSDTALNVAREMVKELEITDWNPIEIAEMIDEEISALVPSWKDWDSQFNQQHCFDYDEDDDDSTYPPFYSFSSHSSSYASLPDIPSSCKAPFHPRGDTLFPGHDWRAENWNNYDDASSQSSMNSYKFSNLTFLDRAQELEEGSNIGNDGKTGVCTRFCPQVNSTRNNFTKKCNAFMRTDQNSNHELKITRVRSMVDLRSQLLHRSLLQEINKRRQFKTIGAVENIGYYEPSDFSGNPLAKGSPGRSAKNISGQGFEW